MLGLNTQNIVVASGLPLCQPDQRVFVLDPGMGFPHQECKIFYKSIAERPHGGLVHGVNWQVVKRSEVSHFFPSAAIKTQPPHSQSSHEPHAKKRTGYKHALFHPPYAMTTFTPCASRRFQGAVIGRHSRQPRLRASACNSCSSCRTRSGSNRLCRTA